MDAPVTRVATFFHSHHGLQGSQRPCANLPIVDVSYQAARDDKELTRSLEPELIDLTLEEALLSTIRSATGPHFLALRTENHIIAQAENDTNQV